MATLKERLEKSTFALVEKEADQLGRKSNAIKPFFDIYVWQELCKLADKQMKKAWSSAQDKDGPIEGDDAMRSRGEGEHIAAEAGQFSCYAKVTAPRNNFNKELFVEVAAKRFRVPKEKILEVMKECTEEGKPVLMKRVVEVE